MPICVEVNRSLLDDVRLVDAEATALGEGEVRLAVRRFGFSANNITYAVFGDAMGYWSFFPCESGWGRIPVWGFAEVVESNGTGLEVGELVYGYLPMGSELAVRPTRISGGGFVDASPHRAALPQAYNGYTRCAADPVYDPATEPIQMLFRPLFMTDFVLDDWLADQDFFGADLAVLSSASSKTAFGLAHLIAQRGDGPEVIGLTADRNVDFCEGLGVYDRVVTYDRIDSLAGPGPAVYVDMSGDGAVRAAVHHALPGLAASVQVGGTHWGDLAGPTDLPGPTPALFFAPDQIVKRRHDWGADGVDRRFGEAWADFLPFVDDMIEVVERQGTDAVIETYRAVLDGSAAANQAFVLSVD